MLTAGIDMGAKNIKVVLLRGDRTIAAKALVPAGLEARANAEKALQKALETAGASIDEIAYVVATGAGREDAPHANGTITEVSADVKGILFTHPTVRTVIAVGAEEGRGVRCDEHGRVIDFAVNEKCAAGAGAFTEAMARALEVPLEELGPLSLRSTQAVPMNAQCVVFAESEVVTLVHAQTPKEDIARAVHDAIADRIVSMVRKVGFEKDIAIVGGMAHNPGFVQAVKRDLESDVIIPDDPMYVGALGAALHAAERAGGG
ncbi:MAG: acyl-CoA dehydratase activase [Candidatus Thermoplasmatota archaeon]